MMAIRSDHRLFDYSVLVRMAWFLISISWMSKGMGQEGIEKPAVDSVASVQQHLAPILRKFCFDCHAQGAKEGNIALDALMDQPLGESSSATWLRVLQQLRAGLMPPPQAEQPSPQQIKEIKNRILSDIFAIDAQSIDPGKTTVRRLNRTEYRNTIRDLLGVDYNTEEKFPADDTGHGFDNIAEVLSVSPLLLEKYFDAAREVVQQSVPVDAKVVRELVIPGDRFKLVQTGSEEPQAPPPPPSRPGFGPRPVRRNVGQNVLELLYYDARTAKASFQVEWNSDYKIRLAIRAGETYVDNQFDLNRCEFTFALDGEVLLKREFVRQGNAGFTFEFERALTVGDHELSVEIRPLSSEEKVRQLRLDVQSVKVVGPLDRSLYVKPPNYDRFFPGDVPATDIQKREYANQLLGDFAAKAFRRPVDASIQKRLVDLAFSSYENGATFEAGIAKAMTAILVSPRFIFRDERPEPSDSISFPLVDEYTLASRLSYFLWSTMPDEPLLQLARQGQLRNNMDEQVQRMLTDSKSQSFIENFVGQWLKARSIESIPINSRAVTAREARPDPDGDTRRKRFFELFSKQQKSDEEQKEFEELRALVSFRRGGRGGGPDLTPEVRRAMRRETEMFFEHILREDRSLIELVDSNYIFLNQALAEHYQISGVEGEPMRLFPLPPDSMRGGLLTQGTILAVTSNPDRTSPVKRGLFVLENLLGSPPPAAPPDIPALEAVKQQEEGKKLSLRETLAVHRESSLCSSCHNRMDPLGLALENFNAMGRFRDKEFDEPIDVTGQLATGESFANVKELKQILATTRRQDIYRCVTEKMLAYSLGREVQVFDIPTVDGIVSRLEVGGGKSSNLLFGILHSSAFQRMRHGTPSSQTTSLDRGIRGKE